MASLLLGMGLFVLPGCGLSEEEALNKLRETCIEHNSETPRAAASGDENSAIKLFLQGECPRMDEIKRARLL